MKNKFVLTFTLLILSALILGCSFYNPLKSSSEASKTEEKSTSDKAIESVVVKKIGVPECDELMDYISQLAKSEDDNYVTKATREFFLNRIREGVRKSVEENKDKPEELAKNCKEYKTQLETYKAEEDDNK